MDDTKREELLARRLEREKKQAEEKRAHDDLCLELEDRFSADGKRRGKDFQIVNEENEPPVGPIVVGVASLVAQKAFTKSDDRTSPEEAQKFVRPHVLYPDAGAVGAIFNERHQVVLRCVVAIQSLCGVNEGIAAKKF
jgi:hypothetical protein